MDEYPEFRAAVMRARADMAAYWITRYTELCAGEGKAVAQNGMIFHLKNITSFRDDRGVELTGQVTIKSAASQAYAKHIKGLRDDAIDAEYTVLDTPKVQQ